MDKQLTEAYDLLSGSGDTDKGGRKRWMREDQRHALRLLIDKMGRPVIKGEDPGFWSIMTEDDCRAMLVLAGYLVVKATKWYGVRVKQSYSRAKSKS